MAKRLTIEEMQEIAKSRGGKCLSDTYVNCYTKLLWRCKEGHEWWGIPSGVKVGYWCKECAINAKKSTIEDMHDFAKSRGGECLSDVYVNNVTKLLWRCKEGHEWMSKPNIVKNGSWCPKCDIISRTHTIEQMRTLAKSKGGECLSDEYIGSQTKLHWRCSKGHEWMIKPADIIQGHWCPNCRSFKTENKVRDVFELLFDESFNKVIPDWLINPKTGWKMELDGLNKSQTLGFEYNGYQHYVYPNHFHKTKGQFLNGQEHDKIKLKRCKELGITLIVIPYTERRNLHEFIISELEKAES